jgi:hypothetical protein
MLSFPAFVEDALAQIAKVRIDAVEVIPHVLGNTGYVPRCGNWVEFGFATGRTFQQLYESRGDARLWGFDSFHGLPEDWRPGLGKGHFARDAVPVPPEGAHLIVGEFEATLPYVDLRDITLVHIDSDLYSSACTALRWLSAGRLHMDAIIVLDELYGYPGFEKHEMAALYAWHVKGARWKWLAAGLEAVAIYEIGSVPW